MVHTARPPDYIRHEIPESDCRMTWIEPSQSQLLLRATGCALVGYFLGCFATGYYLVRTRLGADIREMGSGNIGARNVGRVLGKSGFLLTVFGDFGKGALAVWLANEWTAEDDFASLAMLAAVAGHLWPAQLKFHGGKGVATSLGALLVFDFRLALAFAILFLSGFVFARKTTLPAMLAFATLPAAGWFFGQDKFSILLLATLAVMILFAHRKNLAGEFAALKSEPPKL
jgi:acyl phosphate:glycerol-3-phosphate acyltransferase